MAKSDVKAGSILEAVARHEHELIGRIDSAEREADNLLSTARGDAARMQEESLRKLEQESLELRRQAEAAREALRIGLERQFQADLESRREYAQQKAPEVLQEVMALILPARREGHS